MSQRKIIRNNLVVMDGETVWLSQAQMAELFKSSRTNVVEHIQHIYEDEELVENLTCRKFRQVRGIRREKRSGV